MAKLVGKYVTPSRNGKPLADINGFCFVVPNPIRIGINQKLEMAPSGTLTAPPINATPVTWRIMM